MLTFFGGVLFEKNFVSKKNTTGMFDWKFESCQIVDARKTKNLLGVLMLNILYKFFLEDTYAVSGLFFCSEFQTLINLKFISFT